MSEGREPKPRFAIYWLPDAGHRLSRFAAAWLGRDAADGEPRPRPVIAGLDGRRLVDITREPSLYGFHATLKPPFALAQAATFERLTQTALAFTASRRPFRLPPLRLASLSQFLALTPAETASGLHALADDCVRVFDPFRLAEDDAELARRRTPAMTVRQEELLRRWGYPFVLDEWRFHLTLTSRLDDGERARVAALLEPLLAPLLAAPLSVDAICLVAQEHRLAPFRLVARYPFGG